MKPRIGRKYIKEVMFNHSLTEVQLSNLSARRLKARFQFSIQEPLMVCLSPETLDI